LEVGKGRAKGCREGFCGGFGFIELHEKELFMYWFVMGSLFVIFGLGSLRCSMCALGESVAGLLS
jgi:hypothetical protein